MHIIDTHCHIHDQQYGYDVAQVVAAAKVAGVVQLICIGTSALDSQSAVQFVEDKSGMWCTVGLHPHDAKLGEDDLELITRLANDPKVVAIGEFGLDYYYENSPKKHQKLALEYQLQLATSFNKPCVFHVRNAFDDFWPIIDNFSGVRGVVHSFSDSMENAQQAMKRGLMIGLNGIMTFTKDEQQRLVAKQLPLEYIVLETDSPFLTPIPKRGTINTPANVRLVAAYLAELRGEALESLVEATTSNAQTLFHLSDEVIY